MKKYILVAACSALGGGYLAYKNIKPEVQIVEREKIVEKVVTRIKEVKKPDGTIITETEKTEDKTSDTAKSVVVKKDWNISLYTNSKQLYGIAVQRRILSDFYLYTSAQTNGQLAIGIGVSF
jgi:glucosamine 6-phosphate synthetase-like amidotransferase/phosphosugar isomerase protein